MENNHILLYYILLLVVAEIATNLSTIVGIYATLHDKSVSIQLNTKYPKNENIWRLDINQEFLVIKRIGMVES